jgi:hypothetical protein
MHRFIAVLAFLAVTIVTPASAQSQQGVTIKSAFCKNLYAGMREKPSSRAIAISRDGEKCHAVWGTSSQSAANNDALKGCERGVRKCVLFRI